MPAQDSDFVTEAKQVASVRPQALKLGVLSRRCGQCRIALALQRFLGANQVLILGTETVGFALMDEIHASAGSQRSSDNRGDGL